MSVKNGCWLVFGLAAASLATPAVLYAAEHPAEHPMEHPGGRASPMMTKQGVVSKEDLAKAIEAYVKKDTSLKGGFFVVYDRVAKKPLALSLVKVHKDKLCSVGGGAYFACADFKTPEGKLYDLDVFMRGPNKQQLQVTAITVHKESGKARYAWIQERGLWKKKALPRAEEER